MNWYLAKVKVTVDSGKGTKKLMEQYMVNAVSVTDAETKVHDYFKQSSADFEVDSISNTKVRDIVQ